VNINIEKSKAIALLNKRIQELDNYDYDPQAWRSKVQSDVTTIFGAGQKVIDIISLTLDTPYSGVKQQLMQEDKIKAKKMLEGFIESINDHIADTVVSDGKHNLFNNKIELLQKDEDIQKLKASLQSNIVLIKSIQNEKQELYSILNKKDKEIEQLKSSMWQLEGVNISRLWMVFKSLPLKQQVAVVSFFVILFMSGFAIGVFFQKNHWLG
jgi:Fe2+ transport system protein B